MNKYEGMDDCDLDRFCAEKFMTDYELGTIEEVLERGIPALFVKHGIKGLINIGKWNPCHLDSNQCERYLFPKLHDEWCEIEEIRSRNNPNFVWFYEITINYLDKWGVHRVELISQPENINRAKVIACLKVWDKLNEK